MHDCLNCAYEEFFLTSLHRGRPGACWWTSRPTPAWSNHAAERARTSCCLKRHAGLTPPSAVRARWARRPTTRSARSDPANIHHSYTGDFVKFRNTHNGNEQHVFHLHNHQWLFNPNDDNSNYLDAQGIGPGIGLHLRDRQRRLGQPQQDAPATRSSTATSTRTSPRACGTMWRNHDVFETGTASGVADDVAGKPDVPHARRFALQRAARRPPAPARCPTASSPPARRSRPWCRCPARPLPPMPAAGVTVMAVDRNGARPRRHSSQAKLRLRGDRRRDGKFGTGDDVNPGFPFWIAGIEPAVGQRRRPATQGIVGQRPPTPPLDMLTEAEAQALVDCDGVEPFKSSAA
ncbi:MAG: hypothetical protein MZW92_79900 [Comamonadaceae bacterium]|nr:hypothetical protein [Comamonadaceae bacterium]